MIFISPQPYIWNKIWKRLNESRIQNKLKCAPPPTPLILAGWAFSDDSAKQRCWQLTLDWADINGLKYIIPELAEEEKYYVEEYRSWTPFFHEFTSHLEKYKPTLEETQNALDTIKLNWTNYLGKEFGDYTKPESITGKKARRLVVRVHNTYLPPWGTWTTIQNGCKQIFSAFRKKINEDISPLEIDHIDFFVVPEKSSKRILKR